MRETEQRLRWAGSFFNPADRIILSFPAPPDLIRIAEKVMRGAICSRSG
jgi:hypothetical protein